jgi:hypothetical protein
LQHTQKIFVAVDPWLFKSYAEASFLLGKRHCHLLSRWFILEWLRSYLGFISLCGFGHAYDSNGTAIMSPKYEATYEFNVRNAIADSKFAWRADVVEAYKRSVRQLQNKRASVTFIKLPLHPEAYKYDIVRRNFCEFDKFINSLAKELNVEVIGTFFPPKDLTAGDFYDEIHIRKSGLRKVLKVKQSSAMEIGG